MRAQRRAALISIGIGLALIAGLTALFALAFVDHHAERSFVTYRYARNLAGGQGFVYNPGERVLSDGVAPPYVLLLSLGTKLTPDIPALGNLIGVVALALGGLALFGVVYTGGGKIAAPISTAIYAGFPLLWATLGLETTLWMALGLLAVWLHSREWGIGAAVAVAVATLIRPETGGLALILVADSLIGGRPTRALPGAIYAGVVGLEIMWALVTFESGGPLPGLPGSHLADILPDLIAPNVVAGLGIVGRALFAISWLWAGVLLLAVPGALRLKEHHPALILVGWAGLHLLGLVILRAAVSPWNYAPLIPALGALGALGVEWLTRQTPQGWVRWAVGGVACLLVAGAVVHSYAGVDGGRPEQAAAWEALTPTPVARNDVEAGAWLRDNTAPEDRVGVTRIGVLGYIADRHLLDYRGRLQPDLAQAVLRGDGQWWLGEYAPEYVVLRASEVEELDGYSPTADPSFTRTYAEAARFDIAPGEEEPVLIFRRAAEPLPLTDLLAGMVTFSEGLTLNGVATDFALDPLEMGRTARVRLEWVLDAPIEGERYVAIRIQNRTGVVAALAGRTLDFSDWPQRRLITSYHTIELAPALSPGVYDLEVGIGSDPYALTWQPVTHAKVPFKDETFVGGVSGTRADFGDIALLGYRLVRAEETLDVSLMWQAVAAPRVDYRVLIQVRDARGSIVAQAEVEPHEGTYPTSIWSAGERVPDTYHLDIAGLAPGDYQVYAGLVGPGGSRLLTLDGRDAVLVGHLSIMEEEEGETP
jgi:hypothetical protein